MSGVLGKPVPDEEVRANAADQARHGASSRAGSRGPARTVPNGEELDYGETFAANYHKGLPHGPNGFVEPAAYRAYVDALLNQEHARFEGLPVGENFPATTHPRRTENTENKDKKRRKLTSPFTGHVYDLQGADAGGLGIPAAPALSSDEFAAEMAELYAMALLRDETFGDIDAGSGDAGTLAMKLGGMPWFSGAGGNQPIGSRRRTLTGPQQLFRGSTPGSHTGPWLSQFLLVGNRGPGGAVTTAATHERALPEVKDGFVYYGTQFVDQRSVVAKRGKDWLQTWASWLDAQNGVDFSGMDMLEAKRQFITTPRDIATYVHFDALYQAYQVACLLMLAWKSPFSKDRGLPETGSRTRAAFASYGGPHILSLVTEVATRALKLVWRQKWLYHRRLRPEVAAALITLYANKPKAIPNANLRMALAELHDKLPTDILQKVTKNNATSDAKDRIKANTAITDLPAISDNKNFLLPMAFPEGSPTHPAYGAGHATVAGACVTALKAFFEMYEEDGITPLEWPLTSPGGDMYGFGKVYVGNKETLAVASTASNLTIQGELDKLAGNIAIARNIAGVHYYTDYFASIRQGERLTVSILEEQAALYNEPMSMSFTSFDGDRIRVRGHGGTSTVSVVDRDGHSMEASDWYQRYL